MPRRAHAVFGGGRGLAASRRFKAFGEDIYGKKMRRSAPVSRVYLDWNATTPLRAEAKAAMIGAMELVGNPSSVHAEGRAAKGMIERARKDLAAALGAEGADIIFTSSATEAAALALAGRHLSCAGIEHDAVRSWCTEDLVIDGAGRGHCSRTTAKYAATGKFRDRGDPNLAGRRSHDRCHAGVWQDPFCFQLVRGPNGDRIGPQTGWPPRASAR